MNTVCRNCEKSFAVAIFMTVITFTVAAADIVQLLPPYSAVVIGVNLNALCSHQQGAILFDRHIAPLTDAPLERVDEAYSACDINGRKRVLMVRFDQSETLTRLAAALAGKKAPDGEYPAYILQNISGSRGVHRLCLLDENTAGIYWRFPENQPFRPDCRGLDEQFMRYMPERSGVMLRALGFPKSGNRYLQQISAFDFVLESDCSGELLFHGKFVCRSVSGAAMASLVLSTFAPEILEERYRIPPGLTLAAIRALQIRRDGNVLRFSCRDVEPVIVMFAAAVKNMIPDYRMVIE